MDSELLDIQPPELKFLFELKKQSSCVIRLVNKFNDYVAFKVKTTSPKKYCVRPNVGILKPKAFCDFTVTMQAPKQEPPDMICKDKFLVQSTVVPASTTDDDVTSKMFVRDDGRYIEEAKLRVVLLSPPNSPILSPINAISKQDPLLKASELNDNALLKHESYSPDNQVAEDVVETKINNNDVVNPIKKGNFEVVDSLRNEEYSPVVPDYRTLDYVKDEEDPSINRDIITLNLLKDGDNPDKHYETINHVKDGEKPTKDEENEAFKTIKHLENSLKDTNIILDETKLMKDVEQMKSKLNLLESKLIEAQMTISKLTEERRWTGKEREILKQEMVLLRSKRPDKKVMVGFPFLFVCMVALVGTVLGYTLRC